MGGDIKADTPLGNIKTTSRKVMLTTGGLPDSVILGGKTLMSHVVKYEELSGLLVALFNALALHCHAVPGTVFFGGPANPCFGVTSIPVFNFAALSNQIPTIKSLQVGVSS